MGFIVLVMKLIAIFTIKERLGQLVAQLQDLIKHVLVLRP